MASSVTSNGVPEPAVVEQVLQGEFVALCQSIRSPTPRTRLQAAAALGCFGVKALLPLAIAVNDVEAEVRIAAIRAAGQFGTENGIALISAALHDTDHSVQMCAAEVLGRLDDPRVLEPLITAFEGCFVGKSARAQLRLAPLELVVWALVLLVVAGSIFGASAGTIFVIGLYAVTSQTVVQRRRARSQFCRVLVEALVTVAEKYPHVDLRHFGAEFRAVAANALQHSRADRERVRAAAERIDRLPQTFHDLPGPASAPTLNTERLPLPATVEVRVGGVRRCV